MSTLLVWREQLQILYAKHSGIITKGLRLVLGLMVFGMINSNIGFMKTAASAVCTVGLSVICAFLPLGVMVLAATALILLHLYTLSMGVAIVAALMFVLMYIFYFRFSPKKAWIVLLTAVMFGFKLPLVMPVAAGLLGGISCIVPVICGTFVYYMLHLLKVSAGSYKAGDLIEVVITYTKQVLTNKELMVMVAAVVLCILLVYGIRSRSVDHAWKIAAGTGTIAAVGVCIIGNVVLNLHIPYATLLISAVLAVLCGLLLEVMFLSVDYSRTETMEFEDDEYHYYVKAVPKLAVTAPEKNVKRITEHQNDETEDGKDSVGQKKKRPLKKNRPVESEKISEDMTETILLTQSLNRELGIEEPDSEK